MLIGLAPEGKVRVWLRQYGHSDIPSRSGARTKGLSLSLRTNQDKLYGYC
ncbi:hypothetical protein ACNKWI_001460 [Escherichia coli]|nr:hypothetical protein [Escherichia coli]